MAATVKFSKSISPISAGPIPAGKCQISPLLSGTSNGSMSDLDEKVRATERLKSPAPGIDKGTRSCGTRS